MAVANRLLTAHRAMCYWLAIGKTGAALCGAVSRRRPAYQAGLAEEVELGNTGWNKD